MLPVAHFRYESCRLAVLFVVSRSPVAKINIVLGDTDEVLLSLGVHLTVPIAKEYRRLRLQNDSSHLS